MTYLYLHYRASTGAPWTNVPDLTSAFPAVPLGALPVQQVTIASEPASITPLCCANAWLPVPGGSADDAGLILRVQCAPIPLPLEASVVTFLINYKLAALHEAKFVRYGQGGFVDATLSLIEAKERHGMLLLSFRLAATLADALVNT